MEESFEDILAESRRTQHKTRQKAINKKLWITIGICSVIMVIGWSVLVPMPTAGIIDQITLAIISVFLSFPFISGLFALPISLIPMNNWDYGTRFYRVFLIVLLFWDGIIALFLTIMGIIELIKML